MASEVELKKRSEIGILASKNRHSTRSNVSKSIDFVFHSPISTYRQRADGGIFPTSEVSSQQRRLGTASNGHGRQYLVSDFIRKANASHFSKGFAQKFETPKAFNVKKTEFTSHIEEMGQTYRMIRPNVHTMRAMQENFKKIM